MASTQGAAATAKTRASSQATSRRRVAIVAGLRSPFVKSGGAFAKLSALQLGTEVVRELVMRSDIDPEQIERLVFGQVVVHPSLPNIAREVSLAAHLPHTIDAYSVSRACATSTQAIVDASMAIIVGDIDVALVGGVDSLSRPPITYQDNFVDALMAANQAKAPQHKLKAFLSVRPKDLVPRPPAIAEHSTGWTMGQSAEKMAKENNISREAQDALAARSHQRAHAAWQSGVYDQEVMHISVPPKFVGTVSRDNIVRGDTSKEKMASLKPAFDKKFGTITAANSSPLTDGASALLLMEEKRAQELGFEPLAFVRTWAFAAVDPAWQLLQAPAVAIPKALQKAALSLSSIDFIDMHEAFAAQVLSNIQGLNDVALQKKYVARDTAVGEIDIDKLNVLGGSIALGHPFAATGARQALTMARALARRGQGTALMSQCTAGGLGACLILER